MNDLKKEVRAFRNTAEEFDDMDAILKVKITILNQLNETVDVYREAIARVSKELARQLLFLSSFKGETRSAVSK